MKYIVYTITTLLYLLAAAAIGFGLMTLGRAAMRLSIYGQTLATPVYLPSSDNPYALDGYANETTCWDLYEYEVAGQSYRGGRGCAKLTSDGQIRVLYRRDSPAESTPDDISKLIADGMLWAGLGFVLGLWAHQWRSKSVAIHGRPARDGPPASGAWGLLAMLGMSAVMARDIADTREGFCDGRRAMLTNSMVNFLYDHERRLPRDWLRAFQENVDKDGVFTGSSECLSVTEFNDLAARCGAGFHITANADIGSAACELTGGKRYRVDFEFVARDGFQTVNVRFLDAP